MKAKANLFRTLVVVLPAVLVALAVALFGVGLRTAETQTTNPKMQDLGTLGGSSSGATGINDRESPQVVGYSSTSNGEHHAFLYDEGANPKMQDLGTLEGGANSRAFGINTSGQVVGWSDTSNGEQHAFIYDSANGMQDLNDLIPADSGWTITSATAINSDGKIAASGYGNMPPDWASVCPGQESGFAYAAAFVLTPATTDTYEVQDLGTLGGYYSQATGINDSGQVVGYSYTNPCIAGEHAFLYDASATTPKMQDLGTLGSYRSEALGINAFGKVVGQADDPEYWDLFRQCGNDACQRAFLYDEGANPKMQNLGTLLGDTIPMAVFGSAARDINDSGKVVGVSASQIREDNPHAFLYDASATTPKMQDLNTLLPADPGWTITSATAINSNGKIAASGYKDGVGTHALLLTPTSDSPPPDDDSEAPTVMDSSLMPASGATGVLSSTNVTATFSEEMLASSINGDTFKLFKKGSTTKLAASVSYPDSDSPPYTAKLDPSNSLRRGATYMAVVTTGAKDLAGNSLAQQYSWFFTVSK